ncbi:AAA family ATPase [Candidatus Poribacteria bacterium]|nr:AAA family ATPase [Candidatus Poribacteria bacterium]
MEVRLREVNAEELRTRAINGDIPKPSCIPILGREGYLVRGWATLLAAYPKAGKTELAVACAMAACQERVLYITEESEDVWAARLESIEQPCSHINIVYGFGVPVAAIMQRIAEGDETLVILDTVRHLLAIEDENNNSEVARAMTPLVSACRARKKTLLALHHRRKNDGEGGRAVAGGHAFMGVVDVVLEMKPDGNQPRRRLLTGAGRVYAIADLLYEMDEDGDLVALGDPMKVSREVVSQRLLDVLTDEWQTTADVTRWLDAPIPSSETVRQSLNGLAKKGDIQRDPPIQDGPAQGKKMSWRRDGA